MLQWFAVKTHPRRELQVCTVLARRGIEAYLPQIPARRRPGQRVAPLEPLFPGYIFSRLDVRTSEWIAARSAPGVAYFLGPPGMPTALPDDLVESIRTRTETRQREGWRPQFRHGERVVIRGGPFGGLEAVFDGTLSASGRVQVLLKVVHRIIKVNVDADSLERAV